MKAAISEFTLFRATVRFGNGYLIADAISHLQPVTSGHDLVID
ncbi:hypothetical protein QIG26_28370 [Klebsiella pneumoniae]|nr:hypothetical protein [Klebsiella pneumoniae]